MADQQTQSNFAGRLDIGSRSLFVESHGDGSPAVILEAGFRERGDVWKQSVSPDPATPSVVAGVSAFTRVICYDRPGTLLGGDQQSRSDAVAQPRTGADVVADLAALLSAMQIPGPCVFVGHSIGGIFVRLVAAAHPHLVAGLVLVDPSHEDQNERYQSVTSADQFALLSAIEQELPPALAGNDAIERMDIAAVFAEMRQTALIHPLPPMPLAVVTHGHPVLDVLPPGVLPPDFPVAAFDAVGHAMHEELAALVPGGRLIGSDSGHRVHVEQPEIVIETIRQVVEAVRDLTTWPLTTS